MLGFKGLSLRNGGVKVFEGAEVGVFAHDRHEHLKALKPSVELHPRASGDVVPAPDDVAHVVGMIGQQKVDPAIVQGVAAQVINPLTFVCGANDHPVQ
jgi:hypothetical protein